MKRISLIIIGLALAYYGYNQWFGIEHIYWNWDSDYKDIVASSNRWKFLRFITLVPIGVWTVQWQLMSSPSKEEGTK